MVLLQIEKMTQFRVGGNAHFLFGDYLFHLLLDGTVVGLYGTFHNIVAVFINEIGDYGKLLVRLFFRLYFLTVHYNLGMEDFLLDAFSEVIGNSTDKHTLRQSADFTWWYKAIHLRVD